GGGAKGRVRRKDAEEIIEVLATEVQCCRLMFSPYLYVSPLLSVSLTHTHTHTNQHTHTHTPKHRKRVFIFQMFRLCFYFAAYIQTPPDPIRRSGYSHEEPLKWGGAGGEGEEEEK